MSPYSAIEMDNPFYEFLATTRVALSEAEWGSVEEVTGPFGIHGIDYESDEEGEFAIIGFTVLDEFYVEIEDGTYGELQGFRIYREDVEGVAL